VEEDQLTVTLRMLAEGQQMLTDILGQLDKLPAERTVKVNVVSDTAGGGISGAADQVNSEVTSMNDSMRTMPAVAEETSSKVSSSMGKSGMSGAFSETRGNLNSLTGGMMGFLPIMAGMSLVSATGQFDALAKSVQSFKVMSGTTAQVASQWVGVANIYGLSTNSLGMAMKGLEQHQESLQTTFNKTTGSGVAASIALDKLKASNVEYSVSQQKITTDQEKLNKAVDTYGKNSVKAQSARQTLETAEAHALTTQAGVLRAQDEYNKATGQTNNQLSTIQLAAQRLGITLINNKGQMTSQTSILMQMADAYTKTGGSVQTVADITAILGGRAKALLPMFAEGSQGIKDAMTQTASAGLVLTQKQLTVGITVGKTINDIKQNIKSMFVDIGTALVPVFTYVDQHIGVFMSLAGGALAIFAAVKLWKIGAGFISDIKTVVTDLGKAGSLVSKVSGLFGPTGGAATSAASSAATPGQTAASKIVGAQITVAVFGEAAFLQLKEAMSSGGLPGGGKNPLGTAETVVEDTAPVDAAAGAAGAEAALGGAVTMGAVGTALAVAVPILAVAGVGAFVAWAIMNQGKWNAAVNYTKTPPGTHDTSHGGPTGGGSGDTHGLGAVQRGNPLVDTQAVAADAAKKYYDETHLSMESIAGSWNTEDMLMHTTGAVHAELYAEQTGELQGILVKGTDIQSAQYELGTLMHNHVITTQAQLQKWADNNNAIVLSTGKNSGYATTLEDNMLLAKNNTATNVPKYITAFNALVNNGMNPASITAVDIYDQELLADATAKLLNQSVTTANNAAIQFAATNRLSMPHGGAPVTPPPAHKPVYHKNKDGHKTHYWAEGGLTSESIIGIGQSTGEEYHIGESGPEAILPMGKGRGGGSGSDGMAIGSSTGGGSGGGTVVNISFPNSLTFLNNANQIDQLAKAIETRLATVRLPHRGVRMSPH
jgi:hypothetical protein